MWFINVGVWWVLRRLLVFIPCLLSLVKVFYSICILGVAFLLLCYSVGIILIYNTYLITHITMLILYGIIMFIYYLFVISVILQHCGVNVIMVFVICFFSVDLLLKLLQDINVYTTSVYSILLDVILC